MTLTEGSLGSANRSLVYDALADERRRYALRLLVDAEEPLTVKDIATEIARWEREDDEPVDSAEVKRVHTSLYHLHVPKLADAGIVRYDDEEGRVRLTDSVSFDVIDVLGE